MHLNATFLLVSHTANHLLTCIGICVRDVTVKHAVHWSYISQIGSGALVLGDSM
jgi:hypothetical protein